MNDTLRILQVTPDLACCGAQRLLVDLAVHLARPRYDVAVLSLFPPEHNVLEEELAAAGIRTLHLGKRLGPDLRMFVRVDRAIREFRPHVVHTHRYVLRYALPAFLLRRAPAWVHTVHTAVRHDAGRPCWLTDLAFHAGVVPVAISPDMVATLQRMYRLASVHLIPNGIRVQHYEAPAAARAQIRRALHLAADDLVFVNVARLDPSKNHALLLDALHGLVRLGRRDTLLLVGAGALRPTLEAQAARLGLQAQVRFLGLRTDIPEILAAGDVFVLSSSMEGNPLCVMEAMAAGKAVLSTTVGGVPALIEDGVTGRLVPPGDADALARVMRELAEDEPLRGRLGTAAAREAQRRFDVSAMTRSYEELYDRLVRRSG